MRLFDQPAQTADFSAPFFTFVAFLCCFLLQLLVFVEFVVSVAGWVGAHALSWGRYVMRLSAQN